MLRFTWCSERCQGEKWRTKYNHSGDIPLSRGLGMSGSESETFMDPVYLGLGVNHFHIDRGTLSLLAEPASERVKSTVEAPIKISTVPGTWPGRLSDEIDVMELLGGGPTRQRKSDHGRVDRQKRDQSKRSIKSIWVPILPPTAYSGWPIPSHTTPIVSKWGVPKPGQSCRMLPKAWRSSIQICR